MNTTPTLTYNRTIWVFKSQIQYNSTIAVVQACTIIKISVHIWCRKTVILEISECEKRVFWQSVASDHSRNVNGNELVKFNLVQKKIIHFIEKILEVRASVIITDGTICTTAFVTHSQIQYNSTILFNYCMVLYCTHRSLEQFLNFF